jgi:hypothetical protein
LDQLWGSPQITSDHGFLNDGWLEESFRQGKLVNLTVLDVGARRSRDEKYESFVNWRRVMLFREFTQLYGGLAVFSIVLGVAAALIPALSSVP